MMGNKLRYATVLATVVLALGACTTGAAPSTQTASSPSGVPTSQASTPQASSAVAAGGIARVKEKGLYPAFFGEDPFAFIDQPNGTYTGLDAEVVKACAAKIGLDPALNIFPVQVQWDSLIPGLVAKRYDLIAAGMSSAPKRLEVAISTQNMYVTGSRAMVQKGNPLNIHSWNDVKKAGTEFGYVTGGLEGDFGKTLGIASRGYDTLDAMARDLQSGRLKVIITAELTLKRYIEKTNAPFELSDPWDYQGNTFSPVIYFNKDDVDLRNAFNDCITGMKNDGSLAALMVKFSFDPKNVAPVGAGLP